jgi:hypothetical protein
MFRAGRINEAAPAGQLQKTCCMHPRARRTLLKWPDYRKARHILPRSTFNQQPSRYCTAASGARRFVVFHPSKT